MQDKPPLARFFEDRSCQECGVTFTPQASTNYHCPPCQVVRTRELRAAGSALRRTAGLVQQRSCVDCGVPLPPVRGRPALRCPGCRVVYRKKDDQRRNRARTASGQRKKWDARYRLDSTETIRANNRKYKAAHPETDQAAIHRRRQRRDVGMDGLDRLLSSCYRRAIRNDSCFYCGAAPSATDETDHFFPLSKGGTDHWYNLVRACKPCNRAKRNRCGTLFQLTMAA